MQESYVFEKDDNIASSLGSAGSDLAIRYSKKWFDATTQIQELINDSREAWDFYERNHPRLKDLSGKNVVKADGKDAQTKKKGLRLGLIPRSVDSVMSILHNSLFPADERFFRGTPQNDVAREFQEQYEIYKANNFSEANVTESFRRHLLSLCLDPAAAIAVHWKSRTRKKVEYLPPVLKIGNFEIPIPAMGLKRKVNEKYVEWEGTVAEVLDFNDWRVDPQARCQEESYFILRKYCEVNYVKKEFGIKEVKPYHQAWEEEQDNLGNQKRESLGLMPIQITDEEEGKDKALLMFIYDDFVVDGKRYDNHLAVTLNGQETIWFGENPYDHGRCPYIVHSLMPIPNSIYGLSLIKHAIPSAAVVDTAVDKILKIASLAADPIFEVDMMEPAFRKNNQVKPGKTYPVKKQGAIRQIPINVTNLAILQQVIEKAEDNIREVTGASPVFTGEDFANSPSNITAFQVDQHVQGANSRFQAIMGNYCNSVLEPFQYMAFENDKQFKTKTEYVSIGDEEKELDPDLIKQMDFKWVITSAQASNSRGRQLANLKEWVMNLLPALRDQGLVQLKPQVMVADAGQALQKLLVLGGMQDADKLLSIVNPDPNQMQQQGEMMDGGVNPLQQAIPGPAGPVPGPVEQPGGIPNAPMPPQGNPPV